MQPGRPHVASACSEPAPHGAPALGSAKGPRPSAWSLARSRSRGARLLPSGRLRAPRTVYNRVDEVRGLSALTLSAAGRAVTATAESLDRSPGPSLRARSGNVPRAIARRGL